MVPQSWRYTLFTSLLKSFAPSSLLLALAVAAGAADKPAKAKQTELPEVGASVSRGFFEKPFSLKLTSPVPGALVRATLDGSEPTSGRGMLATAPLAITNTVTLRAAAFKDGARVSAIATHSYIFLNDVLRQRRNPPGLPAGPNGWNGQRSAYEMDPRIVDDPAYRDRFQDAFKSLPVVSLVCRREDMFGPRGLYLNTIQRGEEWERPCSVEMILPDGSTAFQIDCGVRIQGNINRVPNRSPKHSFRLLFKEQYGATKLKYPIFPDSTVKKFDTLVLRADYNNSWIHWDPQARPRAQRTRDAWMKDSHRAMGWVAAHNRYVHLFLNGLYWGVYDFTERPDANFAATYFGGSREDYDVVNEFQAKNGTLEAFQVLNSLRGLARDTQYQKLQGLLDVTNYIDYVLLNYYAGNQDWGENKNWYAVRRRSPPTPFQYLMWDGEQVLHDVHDDTVSNPYEMPFRMAEELKRNAEFRLAFADRVQKHCFNDGALTPAECAGGWTKRAKEVDAAMIAESARWGYYRRNPPFTRDKEWVAEQQRLLKSYFPQRTAIVLQQLRSAGLYPKIAAPILSQRDGAGHGAFKLEATATNGGRIYYTTNGFDPRVPFTGAIASNAQTCTNAILFPAGTHLRARAFQNGIWSALAETTSTSASAAAAKN